jgi:hypothetical protein
MPRQFPNKRQKLAAAALAWIIAASSPVLALVGPTDPAAETSVVMVLNRRAGTAGFCTGVIVAPDIVLTAAHCATRPADMRIHYRGPDGGIVLIPVRRVAIHPAFRADAIRTRRRSIDLALVEAAQPLDSRFTTARLDEDGHFAVGEKLRIVGFGVSVEKDPTSAGAARGADLVVREPLSDVLVWAEDAAGRGAGACQGDSGGPIFRDGAVAAITAWSTGTPPAHCGALTQGVILAPNLGWLRGVLAAWSQP